MVDDIEDYLISLLGTGVSGERSSYSKLAPAAYLLGNQRIGGLLNAVVGKPVRTLAARNRFLADGRPQCGVNLLLRYFKNDRRRFSRCRIPEVGHQLQCILGLGRQTIDLPDHKIDDVLGVALGGIALEIPDPAPGVMIEDGQSFFCEGGNELDGEEWIATRFLMHQLSKRPDACRLGPNAYHSIIFSAFVPKHHVRLK